MIHITIPSFQTLVDPFNSLKKYNAFDLHVNGFYHASVRYSALYNLHEKLMEFFGLRLDLPEFPPKTIWRSLDNKLLNERRETLTRYLQAVIQNQDIAKHSLIENTFLEFQVKSFNSSSTSANLKIFLADSSPIIINCLADDSTIVVMQKFYKHMNIDLKNLQFFGLFLCQSRNDINVPSNVFNQICIKWLKNYESPFISLQLINKNKKNYSDDYKILIRRIIWDPKIEELLLDDLNCLKLLYLQALNDIERGILQIPVEKLKKLKQLEKENNYREFLIMCFQIPSYGYELLSPVVSDFPQTNTVCQLKVGRRQLVLEFNKNGVTMQRILQSTRIRVWRVSQKNATNSNPNSEFEMTFQIEYQIEKKKFGLITLNTHQAVILSQFLQSIATEILYDKTVLKSPTFQLNDILSSNAVEKLKSSIANSVINDGFHNKKDQLSETKDSKLFYTNNEEKFFKIISHQMFFDNETFEDITDKDL